MLLHLSIRDFAIVDRLELEFRPGFTALTGETGAGKSILIDALSLTLGDRAGSEQVRSGAERADVTAEFAIDSLPGIGEWLRAHALEGDPNRLLLRRVVDANGRSRAFINGHAATINQMREAGDRLVDIHGQHAHQSLLRPEAQRLILDSHAGLASLAQETGGAHREWQRLRSARLDHEKNRAARDAEREQLDWQLEELSRLALAPGEWETIQSEHGRLAHAATLMEGVRDAIDSLSESENAALGALSGVLSRLRPLTEFDGLLRDTIAVLESGEAQLREAAYALRHYADRIELDPKRLQEVEQRGRGAYADFRRGRRGDWRSRGRSRWQEAENPGWGASSVVRHPSSTGGRPGPRAVVGVEGFRKRQRSEPGRGARPEITHRGNRAHAGWGRDHCDDAQARGGDARLAVIFAGQLISSGPGGRDERGKSSGRPKPNRSARRDRGRSHGGVCCDLPLHRGRERHADRRDPWRGNDLRAFDVQARERCLSRDPGQA